MNNSKLTLARIIARLTLFISFSIHAAEPLNLRHISFANLQNKYSLSLSQYPVPLLSSQDFSYLEQHYDAQQTEHIRMQQRYKGFPVFGGYAVLHRKHLPGTASSVHMNGNIYRKLFEDLGSCPPKFMANASQQLETFSQSFPPDQIRDQSVQAMVFVDEKDKAHWAYQIQLYLQPNDRLPTQPTVIIAENTGEILLQWDALTTLHQAVYGLGFGGNRHTVKYQYGKEMPYLDLIRDDQSGLCFLENEHIKVIDMHHRTQRPNHPMSFLCQEDSPEHTYWTGYARDGYDQVNGSYSVSNDAMHFGYMIKKMYRELYGVEVLQRDQQPTQLIFRVHFSNYFANAFWDGQQMTFGDGDGEFYSPVTIGIIAHELSHGFTQQHSGLLYFGQAGGINEAFSDMASQAAEYYAYGKASWTVGADVSKTDSALRWFQHPSRDGVSIERATDYQNCMDVHYSSGVYNRLFYLLATHSNWDPQKAFHVMLKANRDYWTPTTNFAEGACGILAASRDLGFSEDDVKEALDKVMIKYENC